MIHDWDLAHGPASGKPQDTGRMRGNDNVYWREQMGMFDETVDQLGHDPLGDVTGRRQAAHVADLGGAACPSG